MIFDAVEWDEVNLEHACRRVSAAEIEQVIANATSYRRPGAIPTECCSTTGRTAASG